MNPQQWSARVWLVALPLLCALQACRFGYRTTLAEPDIEATVAGFVYGGVTDGHLLAGLHFSGFFSFGYYQ
mgnify:CR=1 FL=1